MGKKKWMILAAALLAVFCFVCPAMAETVKEPVSMELSSVYGNVAKFGSHIPLQVRLYGQSEAPFAGTLVVSTLENSNDGKEEAFEYVWEVQAMPGRTSTMEIYVPLGQKSSRIYASLKDESGKTVCRKAMEFDVSRAMGRLLIGTLSEDTGSLQWLDGVSMDYGMVESQLLPMDADSLPSDARGLDVLDLLVIDRFSALALSDSQKEAVVSWTKAGGTLLFGTGSWKDAPFLGLAEGMVSRLSGETAVRTVDMGAEFARETPKDAEIPLLCTEYELLGGEKKLLDEEFPLLTMAPWDRGFLGLFPFELGAVSDFAEKNPSYGVKLLTNVIGEDRLYDLYFYGSYENDTDYWNAQALVTGGNTDRIPNLTLYTVVTAVYLILVGPGLYWILRNKRQGRYYGFAVAVTSLVFCGVIYILGTGTRFTKEFTTRASLFDWTGSTARETTYLNIRTPSSRGFSYRLKPDCQVVPLTRSGRYDPVSSVSFEKAGRPALSLRFYEDGTVLRSGKSRAFDSRLFRLDQTVYADGDWGIEASLHTSGNTMSGSVKNKFPFALEDAAIFLYGQVLPLGRMEAGEERVFQEEPLLVWPIGMSYVAAGCLTGQETEKSGFYSFFLDRYYASYCPDVRFAAFAPADGLHQDETPDSQSDGLAIYTSVLSCGSGQGGLIYRNGYWKTPQTVSSSGTMYGNGMVVYGAEPLAVEYDLGEELEIETVSFLPVSDLFVNHPQYPYIRRFSGEISFYHYGKEIYVPMSQGKTEFSGKEISEYLSPEGKLLVRYAGGMTDQTNNSQIIPLVMAAGRER